MKYLIYFFKKHFFEKGDFSITIRSINIYIYVKNIFSLFLKFLLSKSLQVEHLSGETPSCILII